MKIFKSITELNTIFPTSIALGNFDGIHKGHQALISTCVQSAVSQHLVPSIFTFSNHPMNVISGRPTVKNIISFDEKAELLSALGVEYLFSFEFNESIRKSSPYDFCNEILAQALKAREIFCGFNYRFGYKGQGTPEILRDNGVELGYKVTVLEPVAKEGLVISSTNIRNALEAGEIEKYLLYTGRRYAINGHVIEGLKIGRSIGFPTINLALDTSMIIPQSGVYITQTLVDGHFYDSITNVGHKPTIGEFEKNAETHILKFNRDIYGQDVRVEFIKMLRPEMKFQSFEALTSQIEIDCKKRKNIMKL